MTEAIVIKLLIAAIDRNACQHFLFPDLHLKYPVPSIFITGAVQSQSEDLFIVYSVTCVSC